jgi:hypothetical protein
LPAPVAKTFGFDPAQVQRASLTDRLPWSQPRPLNTSLDTSYASRLLGTALPGVWRGLPDSGRLQRRNMPTLKLSRVPRRARWAAKRPLTSLPISPPNNDGSLDRARELIRRHAESGAGRCQISRISARQKLSAAAASPPSDSSCPTRPLEKSIVQFIRMASLPWEWSESLKGKCIRAGIDYFSTPYDLDAVDMLDSYVELFKIGSGDITWREMVQKVASKGKPVLLATAPPI